MIMDESTLNALIELLKQNLSKPDGTVVAAFITVGGMLAAAALAAFVQWLVTKTVLRSEHNRLQIQLNTDFQFKQFSQWQNDFVGTISDLLAHTDPETYPTPDANKVVALVHKAQLMLNLELDSHRKVNLLINELVLAVNRWEPRAVSDIFRLHGSLLEASRAAIYLPGHKSTPSHFD